MNLKRICCFLLFSLIFCTYSCSSDNDSPAIDAEPEEVSPVNFDLASMPYSKLSDYNFFKSPIKDLDPVYGVLPYEPRATLFTDYAQKARFIWMPKGASANYVEDDEIFDFPSGTILIKNFYYDHLLPENTKKILETRLIIKKGDEWIFANYKWNDEQTEAFFDLDGSFVNVEFTHNGENKSVLYRIPSQAECLTCHKTSEKAIPIGPKPQNLNFNINFSSGSENQLDKWEDFGYLNLGTPTNVNSVVNYNDPTQPLDLRMRSYLDANCAYCHNEDGHCNYLPINLQFSKTNDPNNLGVCIVPNINISGFVGEEVTHIVVPSNPLKSTMYQRIKSDLENIRMPMVGRTLVHEEAVNLTEQWINSLQGECN